MVTQGSETEEVKNHEENHPTTSTSNLSHEWPCSDSIAATQSSTFQAAVYASSPVRYMWGGVQQPLVPHYATSYYGQPGPRFGQYSTKAKAFQLVQPPVAEGQGRASSPSKAGVDAVKDVNSCGLPQSGSDGSSEVSVDDRSKNNKNAFRQMAMEVLESNNTVAYGSCPGSMSIPSSETGGSSSGLMEYWNAGISRVCSSTNVTHPALPSQPLVSTVVPDAQLPGAAVRDTSSSDAWPQDERELKRQRRKQSNRESARRSRLRKQAECEELSSRVDTLAVENVALRSELSRLIEERNKLAQENVLLMEQVLERSQHEQEIMFKDEMVTE